MRKGALFRICRKLRSLVGQRGVFFVNPRLLFVIVFISSFEYAEAQQISGGTPDANGRAMNIYTLSSGGNPGAVGSPYIPTNKFGSVGQPAAMVFDPNLPGPNHNSSGVLTNPTAAEIAGTVLAGEPSGQPTALTFSATTTTSYTTSFTAPASAPTGYLVLRKEGSAVTAVPNNSSLPTVNSTLGDATVVSVGASISIPQSSLEPGTTYFYKIYSYNGTGSTTNYEDDPPLEGNSLALPPSAQPTSLSLSNISATSLTVSYTPVSGADGYLVLRKSSSAPSATPDDAVTYSDGATLGDATVVHVGSAATFNESSLSAGTEYFYTVYAYEGAGIQTNYLTTGPLTGSSLSAMPPAQPTALVFSNVTATSLSGSFSEATGADGYIVLRKAGSAPSASPAKATVYSAGDVLGDATVTYVGATASFTDASVAPATEYFYRVFAANGSGISTNYRTTAPLMGSQVTETAVPTALVFSSIKADALTLSFTAASGATGYLIIKKQGSSPSGLPADGTTYTAGDMLGDGEVVFVGAGTSLEDTGLTDATNYFYDVYSFTGTSSPNYTTGSPLEGNRSTLSAVPGTQPTALAFSGLQTTQLTVGWTEPSPAPAGYIVLRKIDAVSTATPIGGTEYTAGTALGDATVAYVGASPGFTDISLASETLYFYSVMAYNGTTGTVNYLATTPLSGSQSTLALQPAAQPYALLFSNINSTSFKVSFTNSPTTPFPNGYLVIRKSGSSPTGVPVDGTTYTVGGALGDGTVVSFANANTFDETGLTPGTSYFYSIYAFNGGAGSYNYLTTGPLQGSQSTSSADTTPPTVSSTTASSVASGAELVVKAKATESGTGSVASVSMQYRSVAGAPEFTTVDMVMASGTALDGSWEYTVPAAQIGELGVEYKFTATNSVGLTANASGTSTIAFDTPTPLPLGSFGSDVSNYRIVSVPVALKSKAVNDVFADDLGPYDNTKWRMYRYEGGSTNELNGSSTIEMGKGYWLIVKNQAVIDFGEGSTAPVSGSSPFKIDLVAGWNQIGNPYLFNVLWSDVMTASGGLSLGLKTYNGSFAAGTKLNKFEGGFVQTGAPVSILFPVNKNPAAGRTAEGPAKKENALDTDDWEVIFNLSNGDRKNEFGGVGMAPLAQHGYDSYDDFTLPRFLDYVELNHAKRAHGMIYTKDIVPTAENFQWDFNVESNLAGVTRMTWNNAYFGKNDKHLVLWDEDESRALNMREKNEYSFSTESSRAFQVFFGSKEYVQEKTALKGLRIHTISPNPTEGKALIAFSIPGVERSFVKAQIVNLWGQVVAVVFEGMLDAGYNEVTWSGKDAQGQTPAEGIYLVQVVKGKETSTKRLVIK